MSENFGEPVECYKSYWKFWNACRMWSKWM